jgi:regulator of sigma E protease
MDLVIGIIIGLIILIVLVVVHELGHAIAARRSGVVVEEFGVGFPPKAWGKKLKNDILFSVNWLPLGGFVKLQGENDAAKNKGDYGAASMWGKTKILFAGVVANWLVAIALLTVLAWIGLPKILPDQFSIASDRTIITEPVEIATLTKDYPADKAGLEVGDSIIRFAGREVPSVNSLFDLIKQNEGETVDVIYSRNGQEHNARVSLRDESSKEILGAGLGQRELIRATWSAPIVGVGTTIQYTWATLQGVGSAIGSAASGAIMQLSPNSADRERASEELQNASDSVAGPIGIVGVIFPAAQKAGLTHLIFLTAIISLSLAVMNILPIPALDGGRWLVTVVFRLLNKKLTKEREERIQMIGFSVLMGLVVLVTIIDVKRLF